MYRLGDLLQICFEVEFGVLGICYHCEGRLGISFWSTREEGPPSMPFFAHLHRLSAAHFALQTSPLHSLSTWLYGRTLP